MKCPNCNSEDVWRTRRRGFRDHLRLVAGFWPYKCRSCQKRFSAWLRYPSGRTAAPTTPRTTSTSRNAATPDGPTLAFRSEALRPIAKIVIEAENHAQLDKILLALDQAILSFQPVGQKHTNTAAH